MRFAILAAVLGACDGTTPTDAVRQPAEPVPEAFFATHGVDWSDEVVDARTETSLTFRRDDGTRVGVLGTSPLAYRAEDGSFALIDPQVADVGDIAPAHGVGPLAPAAVDPIQTTLTRHLPGTEGTPPGAFRWADQANTLRSYFPEDARSGVLTIVGDVALRWVPAGAANGGAAIEGDDLRYRETWPGIDERFVPGPGRLAHEFVVAARPAGDADLVLAGHLQGTPGLGLWAEGAPQPGDFATRGEIEVRDGGDAKILIEAPLAWEQADPSTRVRLEYRVTWEAEGPRLAVVVPRAWLDDPARRYPIVVDPTERAFTPSTYWAAIERNQSCVAGALARFAASPFAGYAGFEDAGGMVNDWCDRSVAKFDTSSISDGATVSRVEFNGFALTNALQFDTAGSKDVDFAKISADPVTATDANLWADCAPGVDDYASNAVAPLANNWFGSPTTMSGVDLGATAATDLKTNLALDWFAVAMHRGDHAVEFTANGAGNSYLQLSSLIVGQEPQLYVTYSAIDSARAENASGVYPGSGIDVGDTVTLRFSEATNAYAVTAANIGATLTLSGGHTWGTIQSAAWYTTKYANDTLIVTLGTVGPPTVAVGDTITVAAATITTGGVNPGNITLTGSFGAGTFYYVKKTGTNPNVALCTGNFRENDLANPFLTIQRAVDCMAANHANNISGLGSFFIQVEDVNTYNESVTVTGITTNSTGFVTFRKNPTLVGKPTIDGSSVRQFGIQIDNAPFTVIDGFKFSNFVSAGDDAAVMVKANDVEITNSAMGGTSDFGVIVGWDLFLTPVQYVPAQRVNIHHNAIFNSNADCIILVAASQSWKVTNDTFDGCGIGGVEAWIDGRGPESYGTLKNNVFYGRNAGDRHLRMDGVNDGGQQGLISNYNDLYLTAGSGTGTWNGANQTTLAAWQGASGLDGNSLAVDPQFSGVAGDYHEKSTGGRYQIVTGTFVLDATTGGAIDKADPAAFYTPELSWNGCRANMGAFGGTAEASKGAAVYLDSDGDGYGNAAFPAVTCPLVGSYVADSSDCNDASSAIHPGATELAADGVDQNCDGAELCWRDADNDGYRPDAVSTTPSVDLDCTDPFEAIGTDPTTDCNDANAAINPGAAEIVGDGIDQDCDGTENCYTDADNDGFRPDAVSTVPSADGDCNDPFEAIAADPTTDCNDTDPLIHPGAVEITGDGIDQNCDGTETWFRDADVDTWRPDAFSTTASADGDCADPFEALGTDPTGDCNDANAAIHPGAIEITGVGIDEDCNGAETCYADADDDLYRPDAVATVASADADCLDPFEAVAADATGDCNDADPAIHPGAIEITGDGIDQDCNGAETCYADADDDLYRPDAVATVASADADCLDPFEAVAADATGDCNDADPAIHPGATEIAGDGIDQDCDGAEDCFIDSDDDGYRPDPLASAPSADGDCLDAGEAVAGDPTGDCVDADPSIHPGATEICDGIDQDCTGVADDGPDADGDTVADICDTCAGGDDTLDADADGVADFCDVCPAGDDALDADLDTVADACDQCPGADDALDADFDGVPDGCDLCAAGDDTLDADLDGVADACDQCPGGDDTGDADADGSADA
jgi:hypothetical protein